MHFSFEMIILINVLVVIANSVDMSCLSYRTTSEPFAITTSVLKSNALAPFIFIILIDYASKRST